MKEKFIWILIALMAVAFLYLKVKQAVETAPPPQSSPIKGEEEKMESPPRVEEVKGDPPPLVGGARGGGSVGDAPQVRIGDTQIIVEIADTDAKRSQGLSGRESLAENYGMLFIMDQPGIHHFWMKDMRFPLDIIWIREGRVVDISENVPAPIEGEAPMVISPSEPVDQVLEVNAGFAKMHGIVAGSSVTRE